MVTYQLPERAPASSYVLAVFGLLAACILLAVSGAMNWRFGYSLGKTETDGYIYGFASLAADGFKALSPFFFFAAVRTRAWSHAIAAFVVWLTVTIFALVSAAGHASLNRTDVAGSREVASAKYGDLRAELKRSTETLAWIPQHRPTATVTADIASLKTQRQWQWTEGCQNATTKGGRDYCVNLHKLEAEAASAADAVRLEARIAEINGALGKFSSAPKEADPQASVLSRLSGLELGTVQGMLVLLLVLLLEVGSGLGPYVALAHFPSVGRRIPNRALPAGNDNVEIDEPSTNENVVPFRPAASNDNGSVSTSVSASVSTGAAEAAAQFRVFTQEEAKQDLIGLIAQFGIVPSQDYCRKRWNVLKGTVSRWFDTWEREGLISRRAVKRSKRGGVRNEIQAGAGIGGGQGDRALAAA